VGEIPRIYEEAFKKNGLHSPLNYYRIAVNGESGEDSKGTSVSAWERSWLTSPSSVVPPENYTIQKPVFFGGTEKDMICTPSLQQPTIDQLCPRATSHIFNAGHWVMAEVANEVNETLEKWVESVMSQA
jgi:pimeloyl-ACP methyl ester carboxylesterase